MDLSTWVEIAYLLSAVLFVVGLKRMQSPATARPGNALAAAAMLVAILATVVDNQIIDWTWILVGVAVGALAGGAHRTAEATYVSWSRRPSSIDTASAWFASPARCSAA